MDKRQYQRFLNRSGSKPLLQVDGDVRSKTLATTDQVFSNTDAPAADCADLAAFAIRLNCEVAHLKAIRKVETNGGGFDNQGRPKILFERHYFHRLTDGKYARSHPDISAAKRGGYGTSARQWDRLKQACTLDPDAAFRSCSWGLFQIMGDHADRLGYPSAPEMAHSMTLSEADHYEALCRYIEAFRLADELRKGASTAGSWQAFARGYNGPAYRANRYDEKLALAYAEALR